MYEGLWGSNPVRSNTFFPAACLDGVKPKPTPKFVTMACDQAIAYFIYNIMHEFLSL